MSLDGSAIKEETEQQDTTDLKTSYFSMLTRQQTKPIIQTDSDVPSNAIRQSKTKTGLEQTPPV